MGNRLEHVCPAAWTITELPPAWRYAHVLCMPQRILAFLDGLAGQKKEDVLPFVSLNDLLTASSSHIIGFNPNPQRTLTEHPERPWLYTVSQEVDLQRLKNLMASWVQSLWSEAQADAFLQAWGEGHWVWQKVDLQTADYRLKRRLLPGLITRWLLAHGYQLTLSGQRYPLRAVAATEYVETAELMTEPKLYTPDDPKKQPQLYSYVLRFSVLDTPQTDTLTFAHRLTVRRWLNKRIYIKYHSKRSVYLRWSPGYLDRKRGEHVYGRVKLSYIGGEKQVIWVGNQARVFGDLGHADSDLPPAKDFIENPHAYRETGLTPALSGDYDNVVGTGVSHNDQYEVFGGLTQQFTGLAAPFGGSQRVVTADIKTPVKERNQSFFSKDLALSPRLVTAAKTVRIELHTDQAERVEQLILEAFDNPEANRNGNTLSIPIGEGGQTLEVVHHHDSNLIAPLKDGGRPRKPPTDKDNEERIRYITKAYPKTDTPTVALIELAAYHEDKDMQHRDPKSAIREGLIRAGRIAKFFMPPSDKPKGDGFQHRIKSAVSAALRGLGCRVQPFYIPQKETHLPADLDVLGFWMVRLNRRRGHANEKSVVLPVLVEANSTDLHLQVCLPDGRGGVVRYPTLHQALLGAWETDAAFGAEKNAEIRRFFRGALQTRPRKSPALLLLDEQNLRRVFNGLNDHQDAVVELDGLLAEFPQVRAARLQYSHYDEAPICLPGQVRSKYSGLYRNADHPALFYSLHDVGNQKPNSAACKEDDPSETLNSVGTVQVWMNNLQTGDDPAAWAGIVHQLRVASNHIDFATRVPQPLHDIISWLPKHLSRYDVVVDDTESDELDEAE